MDSRASSKADTNASVPGMDMSSQAQVNGSTVGVAVNKALGPECKTDKEPLKFHCNNQERTQIDLLTISRPPRTVTSCYARKTKRRHTQMADCRCNSARARHFRTTARPNRRPSLTTASARML